MKSMDRNIFWRIVKYVGISVILFGVYIFGCMIGSKGAKDDIFRDWPNLPGCQLTTAASYPSVDGAYLASILKRSCFGGETISYFFYLDFASHDPLTGPTFDRIELENDSRPVDDPAVVWTKDRSLQVTVSTRTLSSTLVEKNQGSNIEIVLVYRPREPVASPNYR